MGTGNTPEGEAQRLANLGRLATDLLRERDQSFRRQGGLTPQAMQAIVSQRLEAVNPGFEVKTMPELLRWAADLWEQGQEDERDITAGLLFDLMHHGEMYAYDLYECAYERLMQALLDDQTRGQEAERLLEGV
jgi:hypothetical protein